VCSWTVKVIEQQIVGTSNSHGCDLTGIKEDEMCLVTGTNILHSNSAHRGTDL